MSVHEAYPRRYLEQTTALDILYAPVVRLEKPEGGFEFEANVDEIQLRCAADGNPAPNIFWRKAGGESILRYVPTTYLPTICDVVQGVLLLIHTS